MLLDNSVKYANPYGDVYINCKTERVSVSLSGGFDSAVTLFLIAKTITDENLFDTEVQPFTVIKRNPSKVRSYDRPNMLNYANSIIDYVKSKFPNVKIQPPITQDAPYWWLSGDRTRINDDSYTGAVLNLERFLRWDAVIGKAHHCDEGGLLIMYDGVTLNPSDPSIPSNNQPHRDKKSIHGITDTSATVGGLTRDKRIACYSPFRNSDKRASMWMAKDLGILEDLLNITRSCEGGPVATDDFKKTCGECWWCVEREWALNSIKTREQL